MFKETREILAAVEWLGNNIVNIERDSTTFKAMFEKAFRHEKVVASVAELDRAERSLTPQTGAVARFEDFAATITWGEQACETVRLAREAIAELQAAITSQRQDHYQCASMSEVIRKALALLAVASDARQKGGKIVVADADNTIHDILI